jgi:hypothetical protein
MVISVGDEQITHGIDSHALRITERRREGDAADTH